MNKNLLGYYAGSKKTIHDRTYTRVKTKSKNDKRTSLAKNLNLLTNNNKHNTKLAKNGWSCSCGLCKPTRHTNTPTLKNKREDLKFNKKDYD